MPTKKIRRIVFDLLHKNLCNTDASPQEISLQATKKYKQMSDMDIIKTYKKYLNSEIVKYIANDLDKSMVMYWVNGAPEKRNMRISEYANHKALNLSKFEKIAICDKLGLEFI